MSKTVLFLCPHGAAKSVMAAAYFQHLATRAGLDTTAESAGTEPDDAVWPSVVALLHEEGVDVAPSRPRHVTPEDLAQARLVISLGCDLPPEQARLTRRLDRWDDLPLASEDLRKAHDAIRIKVQHLVAELQDAAPTRTS
jgi:protein-tyrosine-phosphatase